MTREEMLNEAVGRMRAFGLLGKVINEFKRSQKLEYSEATPLGGILYWVDNEPEWAELINNFEKENECLVYHVIHNHTEFGELLSLLFVSQYEEEWEMDMEDIKAGEPFVYVMNLTNPEFSEFGNICVKEAAGGLIRVA